MVVEAVVCASSIQKLSNTPQRVGEEVRQDDSEFLLFLTLLLRSDHSAQCLSHSPRHTVYAQPVPFVFSRLTHVRTLSSSLAFRVFCAPLPFNSSTGLMYFEGDSKLCRIIPSIHANGTCSAAILLSP